MLRQEATWEENTQLGKLLTSRRGEECKTIITGMYSMPISCGTSYKLTKLTTMMVAD